MKSCRFIGMTKTLGAPPDWDEKTHGPCVGLPVMISDGVCISCWSVSWKERLWILFGKKVFLHVVSGNSQPAVALELEILR